MMLQLPVPEFLDYVKSRGRESYVDPPRPLLTVVTTCPITITKTSGPLFFGTRVKAPEGFVFQVDLTHSLVFPTGHPLMLTEMLTHLEVINTVPRPLVLDAVELVGIISLISQHPVEFHEG